MLTRNPVKRHMHKSCVSSVVPCKAKALRSNATLREMSESLSNDAVEPETMCFDEALQGCLDCVGCSSIEIDCEESGNEQ